MSQQFTSPVTASSPTGAYVPARMSVWQIALAVFVGNLLCALIPIVLYLCLILLEVLVAAGRR